MLLTQFIYLLPFIWFHPDSILQIVYRVFPFNRGLFEDKVANFWCTTNILIKYREILTDASQLSKLALIATLLTTIPINLLIFYKIKTATNNTKKANTEVTPVIIIIIIIITIEYCCYDLWICFKCIIILFIFLSGS